jgi:uncharacterized protein YxjI
MPAVDPNEHDRFTIRQRFRLVINEYEVGLPDEPPFCFVQQKRFAWKEDLRFFSDGSRSQELMRILARQRFDPAATYDVTLPDGRKLGEFQKRFGASLLRSTYEIRGPRGTVTVQERNVLVALFRRLVGFVPYVGQYADWLPIPYHFTYTHEGREIGVHRRRVGSLRDVYDLDLSADADRVLDRRLALATAVGLDALQAR